MPSGPSASASALQPAVRNSTGLSVSAFIGCLLYKPFGGIFNLYLELFRMTAGAAKEIIIGRQKIIRPRRLRRCQMQGVEWRDVPRLQFRCAPFDGDGERNVFCDRAKK